MVITVTTIAHIDGALVLCLVAQSCPTCCNPMNCSPPSSSAHGDSPGKNTGLGCHFLLQGISLTQEWNLGILHCGQILSHLSHQALSVTFSNSRSSDFYCLPSLFESSFQIYINFPLSSLTSILLLHACIIYIFIIIIAFWEGLK